MDRIEILRRLVNQAQCNGFAFERWFQTQIQKAWPGLEPALALLAGEGRYYSLLFSHEFARSFWRTGAQISFAVPSVTYTRVNTRGDVIHVTRKPFTRRTVKRDVWKYHLREMAAAADPLLYICRFMPMSADQFTATVDRKKPGKWTRPEVSAD